MKNYFKKMTARQNDATMTKLMTVLMIIMWLII